jgi:hypothetical protein
VVGGAAVRLHPGGLERVQQRASNHPGAGAGGAVHAQPAAGAVPGLGGDRRRKPHPLRQRGQPDRGGEGVRDTKGALHIHRLPQVRLPLHPHPLPRWNARCFSPPLIDLDTSKASTAFFDSTTATFYTCDWHGNFVSHQSGS